jgi:hypothetical protein
MEYPTPGIENRMCLRYTGSMEDNDINLQFNESAFRHGFTEEDIRWAIDTQVFDCPIASTVKDYDNKFVLVGFSKDGRPMEVMYNIVDDECINIFHANDLQPKIEKLMQERRK